MSNRIIEIIEVLEEVWLKFDADQSQDLKRLRVEATQNVAEKRGIDARSVTDKYARQLAPDIRKAPHFDELVASWLKSENNELYVALLKRSVDDEDERLVKEFFTRVVDLEIDTIDGNIAANDTFVEGRTILKVHLRKERNKTLVASAKKFWDKKFCGDIVCTVCRFSFKKFYGVCGEGYIEAHHKIPISQLTDETPVTIEDLVPVCANCHRMLHRRRPWLAIEELRAMVGTT